MDIESAGFFIIRSPYLFEKIFAFDDCALRFDQHAQKVEFFIGEFDRIVVDFDLMFFCIENDRADLFEALFLFCFFIASFDRFDAREEFHDAKGFG